MRFSTAVFVHKSVSGANSNFYANFFEIKGRQFQRNSCLDPLTVKGLLRT
jgi:hypothetical protein